MRWRFSKSQQAPFPNYMYFPTHSMDSPDFNTPRLLLISSQIKSDRIAASKCRFSRLWHHLSIKITDNLSAVLNHVTLIRNHFLSSFAAMRSAKHITWSLSIFLVPSDLWESHLTKFPDGRPLQVHGDGLGLIRDLTAQCDHCFTLIFPSPTHYVWPAKRMEQERTRE